MTSEEMNNGQKSKEQAIQERLAAEQKADEKKMQHHILVVDDVAINLAQISRLVENAGHKTSKAADATRALQILKHDPTIDGCLIDLKLPDMDGVQLYEHYKKLVADGYARKNLPFVLVTATQNVERFRQAKIAGIIDIIIKPPSVERIAEFLNLVEHANRGDHDLDALVMVKELKDLLAMTVKAIMEAQSGAAAKNLINLMEQAKQRLRSLV